MGASSARNINLSRRMQKSHPLFPTGSVNRVLLIDNKMIARRALCPIPTAFGYFPALEVRSRDLEPTGRDDDNEGHPRRKGRVSFKSRRGKPAPRR